MPGLYTEVWANPVFDTAIFADGSGGKAYTISKPANATLVRVVLNLQAQFWITPPQGTRVFPPLLRVRLGLGSAQEGSRILRQSWMAYNCSQAIYVPSGTLNPYWSLIGSIGDHDDTWDAQTRYGGPGTPAASFTYMVWPGNSLNNGGVHYVSSYLRLLWLQY